MSDPHNFMLYMVTAILVLFSGISFGFIVGSLMRKRKDELFFYSILFICFIASIFIFLKLMK